MDQLNDHYCRATYGRIGTPGRFTNYYMGRWDRKLSEKIKKGYVEIISAVEISILQRMEQLIKLLVRTEEVYRTTTIEMLRSRYAKNAIIKKDDMRMMNRYYKEANKRLKRLKEF